MVSYTPLWETMKKKNVTTYTLIQEHQIQSKTIYNLKRNKNISTATLERLCDILECTPNDILTFEKRHSFYQSDKMSVFLFKTYLISLIFFF